MGVERLAMTDSNPNPGLKFPITELSCAVFTPDLWTLILAVVRSSGNESAKMEWFGTALLGNEPAGTYVGIPRRYRFNSAVPGVLWRCCSTYTVRPPLRCWASKSSIGGCQSKVETAGQDRTATRPWLPHQFRSQEIPRK